jgi:hypothetical protein
MPHFVARADGVLRNQTVRRNDWWVEPVRLVGREEVVAMLFAIADQAKVDGFSS